MVNRCRITKAALRLLGLPRGPGTSVLVGRHTPNHGATDALSTTGATNVVQTGNLHPHQGELQVFCPFPLTCDRQVPDKADRRGVGWAGRVGLLRGQWYQVATFKIGTFAALYHPDAADSDRLVLVAMNICALAGVDDHCCDEAVEGTAPTATSSRLAGIQPALEGPAGFTSSCPLAAAAVTDDPVMVALAEVMRTAARLGTPAQVGRLRRETTSVLLAMSGAHLAFHPRSAPVLGVLKQGSFNGAIACVRLIDLVGGYELSANDRDAPGLRSPTLAARSSSTSPLCRTSPRYSWKDVVVVPRRAGDELIVLVDEDGMKIGTAPKLASHHADTPLHLAFTSYLFDEAGRFLLTRRAWSKKTWPGVWTNSCCGHPLPDEPLGESVNRRLGDELGTIAKRMDVVIPVVRYRAVMSNGIVENELGPVLRVLPQLPLKPSPDEVAEARWVTWEPFVRGVLAGSQEISPWSRITIEQLASLGADPWQWPAADSSALPGAVLPGWA